MNGVCAANRFGACFGETEKSHLARAHKLCHRANCFLDRCLGIDAMLIVEIDYVNAQSAQTSFASFVDIIRLTADPAVVGPGGVTQNSKFCCNDDMFTVSSSG